MGSGFQGFGLPRLRRAMPPLGFERGFEGRSGAEMPGSRRGNTAVLRADEDLTVCGDPAKLARVFNNILKNAAAYSDPNTEILIRGERWEDGVAVTIQNQGPAIPAEKLSAIFEKFYRTDEARASDTGGAGLGLAIAKEIVALHGGTITAESRENTTTFTVTLPGSPSENLNPPLGSS